MGKKVRCKLLTGSFLEPLLQFTSKLEVGINPVSDPRGTKIGQYWYNQSLKTKPKWKAQNFKATLDYDLKSSSSYMILNFGKRSFSIVNGWKHGFYLRQSKVMDIIETHKLINQLVAFERACQGFDDQYEDQDA